MMDTYPGSEGSDGSGPNYADMYAGASSAMPSRCSGCEQFECIAECITKENGMRKYLVFGGDYYYPVGGWDDFQDSFDTAEEAFALARKLVEVTEVTVGRYTYNRADCDWTHVVDVATGMRLDSFQKEGR